MNNSSDRGHWDRRDATASLQGTGQSLQCPRGFLHRRGSALRSAPTSIRILSLKQPLCSSRQTLLRFDEWRHRGIPQTNQDTRRRRSTSSPGRVDCKPQRNPGTVRLLTVSGKWPPSAMAFRRLWGAGNGHATHTRRAGRPVRSGLLRSKGNYPSLAKGRDAAVAILQVGNHDSLLCRLESLPTRKLCKRKKSVDVVRVRHAARQMRPAQRQARHECRMFLDIVVPAANQ